MMDSKRDFAGVSCDTNDLPPWQIRSSRHLIHDRWLKVRADDCVTAEGVEISPYYVLEYPDWVQVVALDAEDHIYLVQQYRHAAGVVSLELPGGGVDALDADPIETAVRELKEETGLISVNWEYVGKLAPNPATQTNFSHIVLARNVEMTENPADDPTERIRLVRMPIPQAVRLALEGKMIQVIHVAALTLALHKAGKWDPSAMTDRSV